MKRKERTERRSKVTFTYTTLKQSIANTLRFLKGDPCRLRRIKIV